AGVGLWYQDFRARLDAQQAEQEREEEQRQELAKRQQEQAELQARQALGQARGLHQRLRRQLQQRGGVFQLIQDPAEWRRQLQEAQSAWTQAKTRAGGVEDLRQGPLGKELDELGKQLRSDQADCDLALQLETAREQAAAVVGGEMDTAGAVKAYG